MTQTNVPPPCPECERRNAAAKHTQHTGEFLEWLKSQGYEICEWREYADVPIEGEFVPVHKRIEQWLADFESIDLDLVDREQKALLEWLRTREEAS